MLDIKFIRENADRVKFAIKNKKVKDKVDIDSLLKMHDELKIKEQSLVEKRTEQNEVTTKIQRAKDAAERSEMIGAATVIKETVQQLEKDLEEQRAEFSKVLLRIPNVVDPKMPVGESDEENVVVRKVGDIPEFDFKPKDHVELGESLDLIEIDKAGQISGSRFYYLKNEAVLMQFGIIQLVMKTLSDREVLGKIAKEVGNPFDKPFTPIVPPVMMRPSVMKKMDRLDPVEERYLIQDNDLVLVGSAEHTLGPLHMDEMLNEQDLPIRYIGYSTAFRSEAGSYGKDVRGILRAHQFDKLEMETYVPVEYGDVEQKFIVAIQEYLIQQLGIPYQLMQICTGDTGKPDYNQFDIESWIPSQNKYRETHTSDYMTDFQARRLNIKYKTKDGEKKFVFMNDATAFAIGRILIAILENYQQKDGSVKVPKVLQDYVGKDVIKPKA